MNAQMEAKMLSGTPSAGSKGSKGTSHSDTQSNTNLSSPHTESFISSDTDSIVNVAHADMGMKHTKKSRGITMPGNAASRKEWKKRTIGLVVLAILISCTVAFIVVAQKRSSGEPNSDEITAANVEAPNGIEVCNFMACGSCYDNLALAVSAVGNCDQGTTRSDISEPHVVDAMQDMEFYEGMVLGSVSVVISGAKFLAANGRRPIIRPAFIESADVELVGGPSLFVWKGESRLTFVLEALELDGLKQSMSAVRTVSDVEVDFYSRNVQFNNFHTPNKVNGSAVHLDTANVLSFDAQSGASGNTAGDLTDGCEEVGGDLSENCGGCTPFYGGSTVYVRQVTGALDFDGTYTDNHVYFNHGQGGVLHLEYVAAPASTIKGTFRNNSATEAGAVSIAVQESDTTVTIDGLFEDNSAIDPFGFCGTRGGALSIRRVGDNSIMTITGTFNRNNGSAFGGVLRNDRLKNFATLTLSGVFTDNVADTGTVGDMRGFESNSVFEFTPQNMDPIPDDTIVFSSDDAVCGVVDVGTGAIKCEN